MHLQVDIMTSRNRQSRKTNWAIIFFLWKYKYWLLLKPYLHHFCSRGKGNARRSLNQQSHQLQTVQSPTCWPTSLVAGVCPLPRLQAWCQGSFLEKASECPYGNPSGSAVFLFEPFCKYRHELSFNIRCSVLYTRLQEQSLMEFFFFFCFLNDTVNEFSAISFSVLPCSCL